MDKRQTFKCAVSGAAAGLANGFFGTGAGVLLVPLLTGWVGLETQKAFATSLAVVFPLCAVSVALDFIRGASFLTAALPCMIGGLIGGALGGRVFKKVPVRVLRKLMGALIVFGGVRSLL